MTDATCTVRCYGCDWTVTVVGMEAAQDAMSDHYKAPPPLIFKELPNGCGWPLQFGSHLNGTPLLLVELFQPIWISHASHYAMTRSSVPLHPRGKAGVAKEPTWQQ